MKIFRFLFLLAVSAMLAGGQVPKPVVFENVTVIDTTGHPPKQGVTVVISNGRIQSVTVGRTTVSKSAQIIDGRGKFLIPGLWDMHVHMPMLSDDQDLRLYVANGVTGVRLMWGGPEATQMAKDIGEGRRLGPRLIVASGIIDGLKSFPGSLVVENEEQARAAVTNAKHRGADFIKVYSFLTREAYFAIADEAKRQRIPFAGHLPGLVTAAEASRAGQASIEHLTQMSVNCSTLEDDFRRSWSEKYQSIPKGGAVPWGIYVLTISDASRLLESYSPTKAEQLAAVFVENRTWQTPTLIQLRSAHLAGDPMFEQDPRLKYVPLGMRKSWARGRTSSVEGKLFSKTPEDVAVRHRQFQQELELVGAMHKSGVGILAGTDVLNPYCLPGFGIHDELQLLVRAGLTPMDALRAATYNPAEFLGTLASLGTVEQGKIADLVLLDADPLKDISNTQKINGVILAGKFFTRVALDKILAAAEAAARSK